MVQSSLSLQITTFRYILRQLCLEQRNNDGWLNWQILSTPSNTTQVGKIKMLMLCPGYQSQEEKRHQFLHVVMTEEVSYSPRMTGDIKEWTETCLWCVCVLRLDLKPGPLYYPFVIPI